MEKDFFFFPGSSDIQTGRAEAPVAALSESDVQGTSRPVYQNTDPRRAWMCVRVCVRQCLLSEEAVIQHLNLSLLPWRATVQDKFPRAPFRCSEAKSTADSSHLKTRFWTHSNYFCCSFFCWAQTQHHCYKSARISQPFSLSSHTQRQYNDCRKPIPNFTSSQV